MFLHPLLIGSTSAHFLLNQCWSSSQSCYLYLPADSDRKKKGRSFPVGRKETIAENLRTRPPARCSRSLATCSGGLHRILQGGAVVLEHHKAVGVYAGDLRDLRFERALLLGVGVVEREDANVCA